ncbi:hypothetical protein RJT34_11800 [Clitoria ternatea]|uniref:Protein EARLY FLOWERING 4 domain-containing protein n=1 Tax=Clitoria ternatea TaxID=43366 RepID=A0AAN9PKT5_CLITE
MDETAVKTKPEWLNNHTKAAGDAKDDSGDDEEECDDEAWDTLTRSFRQAQKVLDENRALIQKVNSNHESKVPDNIVKNVDLIHQINGNISKVLSIYSDLSVNFSNIVRQRRGLASAAANHDDDDESENGRDDSAEHVPEKSEMVALMAAGMHRSPRYHPQIQGIYVNESNTGSLTARDPRSLTRSTFGLTPMLETEESEREASDDCL